MATERLRPEVRDASPDSYAPTGGTAYLMIYNAVRTKDQLIAGSLHRNGESCAIGSFFDVNPKVSLPHAIIEEVAAVNDSARGVTPKQRRVIVLRWLRWKLKQAGMPGFLHAKV